MREIFSLLVHQSKSRHIWSWARKNKVAGASSRSPNYLGHLPLHSPDHEQGAGRKWSIWDSNQQTEVLPAMPHHRSLLFASPSSISFDKLYLFLKLKNVYQRLPHRSLQLPYSFYIVQNTSLPACAMIHSIDLLLVNIWTLANIFSITNNVMMNNPMHLSFCIFVSVLAIFHCETGIAKVLHRFVENIKCDEVYNMLSVMSGA